VNLKSINFLFIFLIFFILGCSSEEVVSPYSFDLEITELDPNKWSAMTKQNLIHLVQIYEISPFIFTKKVNIQTGAKSDSHLVLTLSTKHAENPKKILADFLHEQFHWMLKTNLKKTKRAAEELKHVYPLALLTQSVTNDLIYHHLIIYYLEFRALQLFLGTNEAKVIVKEYMKLDMMLPSVYFFVVQNDQIIRKIIRKNGLLPKKLL
jgi:hypothetical protein